MLIGEPSGWQVQINIPEEQAYCEHSWEKNQEISTTHIRCSFCGQQTTQRARAHCKKCRLTTCTLCADYYLKMDVEVAPQPPTRFQEGNLVNELISYIDYLLAENRRLQNENSRLKEKASKPEEEDRIEEGLLEEIRSLTLEDLQKGKEQITFLEEDTVLKISEGQYHPKRSVNRLYNMVVRIEIPGVTPFTINAILDTGATSCCVDKRSVPKEALEENSYTVVINGVNSKQAANWKLKNGQMVIGENKFRTPFTYSFDMTLGEGIQMVLGCNFIRSMHGGVRIEGNTLTFYKNITAITTKQEALSTLAELEMEEEEYLRIQEQVIAVT